MSENLETKKNDDAYYFHQTPELLARDLISFVPLENNDHVLEPFKGEGAFYNVFPDFVNKHYTEIAEGTDFRTFDKPIDWIISNPPFCLDDGTGKRKNAFYFILDYFMDRAKKGIAFLCNDYCLATLTPKRLEDIKNRGWYLNNIIVCNVKRWRGRYYFLIFDKTPTSYYRHLLGSY